MNEDVVKVGSVKEVGNERFEYEVRWGVVYELGLWGGEVERGGEKRKWVVELDKG